jgi:hypothetical protein
MAASFPASYDALTNPTAGSLLTSPSHATQHINANDVVEAIEQRVGLSGSSFPGSPSTGQFFHHTTRRLDYYYDGTRWLTCTLFTENGDVILGQSTDPTVAGAFAAQTGVEGGIYVVDFRFSVYVGTTNNGSNYWIITPQYANSAFSLTGIGSAQNTSADAVSTFVEKVISVNAVLSTNARMIQVRLTKNGSPGAIWAASQYIFRRIG